MGKMLIWWGDLKDSDICRRRRRRRNFSHHIARRRELREWMKDEGVADV